MNYNSYQNNKNTSVSFRKILKENAEQKLIKSLEEDIEESDEILQNSIEALEENIINQKTPEIAIKDLSIEEIKEKRKNLSKEHYHFPDILKVGNLILKTSPSSAITDKFFISKVPFFAPIQKSSISVLINPKNKEKAMDIVENAALKIALSLPDGLTNFILIDKQGAGHNFKKLSQLHKKFTEINTLTGDQEIENALDGIKQSMASITQSIAGSGFESIEEYNTKADELPQQYTLVVISGFPSGFSKRATDTIISLLESGYKAGVYVFMTIGYDPIKGYQQLINGRTLLSFIENTTCFYFEDRPHELIHDGLISENIEMVKVPLKTEEEFKELSNSVYKIKPEEVDRKRTKDILALLNKGIENVNLKPIIDIKKEFPTEDSKFWRKDPSKGICVPFAKRGIENVYFSLGINEYGEQESTHHALIAGMTGSGKTVLLNDIILMAAAYYSPKELNFYLLDYKMGVEFAVYQDLPHVKILSVDSEIEFGHQTLHKAISIMNERDAKFKKYNAGNLASYNASCPKEERLPRIVFIIDEFQVLYPKDQKITSVTNEAITTIVRLARSFGVNFVLSTQTLRGIDLDPAILPNVPLRIAMQMEAKDATKIFNENNDAPRFLTNTGEGIYNKQHGESQANIHFQAYFADDKEIKNLVLSLKERAIKLYGEKEYKKMQEDRFIYNGETEGDINTNIEAKNIIENKIPISDTSRFYIGEPAGLSKTHISTSFTQEFAENMIIVGEDPIKAASIFGYSAKFASLQEGSKIYLINSMTSMDKCFKETISDYNIAYYTNRTAENALNEVYDTLLKRAEISEISPNEVFPKIYFFNFFINNSKIFSDNSFNSKTIGKISKIISEGPELGIFTAIYSVDYSKLTETSISKDLSKFHKKIALVGGQSIKLFGMDASVKFSRSKNVSIIKQGIGSDDYIKFKPYIDPKLKICTGGKK